MKRPPRLAELLLRFSIPVDDRDAILGDLAEEYNRFIVPNSGEPKARLWYWRQALSCVRSSLVRRSSPKAPPRDQGDGMIQLLWQDLRYSARALRKNPGFAAVIILTIALGIGANTVVYSIVDNLVLNPFRYPDGNALIGVGPVFPTLNQDLSFWEVLSPAEYRDIQTQSRTLERVVAWDMGNRQLSGEEIPENLFSAFWWGNALDTLRVSPALGRGFTLEETIEGSPVALISYRFWQRRFGGDPGIVGKVLHVNGNPHTLIGVMPAGTLIYGTDLWLPMGAAPEQIPRGRRQFQVLARLVPGRTLQEANSELAAIAKRIELEYGREFKEYAGWRLIAETWARINTQIFRPAALILSGAVGFVMLLVCANMASLFLARTMRRRQELAVRSALGASRARIVSQILTESILLSLLGGTVGLGLAHLGVGLINSIMAATPIPFPGQVALNARVLGFTAALSVFTGLLFGLVPALRLTRVNVQQALQSEGRSATQSAERLRLQSILVGIEVALALILLMGGGLLIHSFLRLQAINPGFDTKNLLTMRLTLPRERYQGSQITSFFQTLIDRVESLPGISLACATSQFPPGVFSSRQFQIEGKSLEREGSLPTTFTTLVTESYFETLGIAILKGRPLKDSDRAGTPMVVVINEVAARRYFPNEDPIGRRIKLGRPDSQQPWFEIVGVAASTQNRGLERPRQPELFASIRQAEGWWNQLFLLIRTEVEPRSLLGVVRREIATLDRDQPVYLIQTVEQAFTASMTQRRISSALLSAFAVFALSLAGIGIFSVVSNKVSARTREIGVRIALGATSSQVRRLVLRQALFPVTIGALAGLCAALAMGNLMKDLLFQISGTDPLTTLIVALILVAVACIAAYLPAYRISRMDPVAALRQE